MNYLDAAIVLLIALIIDLTLGEPPATFHPVVWTGRAIDFFRKNAPERRRKIYGVVMAILLISLISISGYFAVELLLSVNRWAGILLGAFLLKSTFALKSLVNAGERIAKPLENGNGDGAREQLHWLCSRDPGGLTESQLASAAIESIAENFVDAILSPLLFFTIFSFYGIGILAVLGFKVASTLDSMIGYKTEPYRELGFFSARLDDILNFPASRLSILLLSLSSTGMGSPSSSVDVAMRDGSKTESPNSGYPMAAVAGALGVRLKKTGSGENYVLGQEFRMPSPLDIRRAIKILKRASIASFVISLIIIYSLGGLL